MRAEIDMPNPSSKILPGMYAYGKVVIERPNSLTLPKSAFTHGGGKSFIWRYEGGHALRTEVQTGISAGKWTEVTNRRVKTKSTEEEEWTPINTSDQVLLGEKLSTLTEGTRVRLDESPPPKDEDETGTTSELTEGG
jgi:hypothetical protein